MTYLLALEGLIALALLVYLARSARAIGSKLTAYNSKQSKKLLEIEGQLLDHDRNLRRANQLLYLPLLTSKNVSWDFVLSLTSHGPRFQSLAQVLESLRQQVLQPTKILLNIATEEINSLPPEVKLLEKEGFIEIVSCQDLGPAKKLIPTLLSKGETPIIVVDDDLNFDPDLFLQLMVAHHLHPKAIIASRVHRIALDEKGNPMNFNEWDKQFTETDGPRSDLLPTSGSGTLFPMNSLHTDAINSDLYLELAKNTDDLWWYFQGRRAGTLVVRIEGFGSLDFVGDSQEVGLWKNGNQERNEVNLQALLSKYGNPINM